MSINITMPALSPTMEEGKLAKWHDKEADTDSAGDVIAEIETDKATMEVEAVDEGKIGKIVVPEGTDNVKVNAVIAVILTEGETEVADPPPAPAKASEAPKPAAAPAPAPAGASMRENAATQIATGSAVAAPASKAASGDRSVPRVFASPLARRLAKEAGIDVAAINGSGPHGRVVKSDVEAVKSGKAQLKAAPASAGAGAMAGGMTKQQVMALYEEGSYEIVPNDGMRKTVA